MDREEALKRIKEWVLSPEDEEALLTLLPELQENKDERIRKQLMNFLKELETLGKNTNFDKYTKSDCANWIFWLQKEGEKDNWKPSERQMEVLEDFLFHIPKEIPEKGVLVSLHQDLKKLIE